MGQLGIRDLIGPTQWRTWIIDAQQEVGEAEPGAIEEAGLEDDIVTTLDGRPRDGCLRPIEVPAVDLLWALGREVHHLSARSLRRPM